MKLFGFEISKQIKKADEPSPYAGLIPDVPVAAVAAAPKPVEVKSFVPKEAEDGSTVISAGGYFGQYIDIDGTTVASDQDLILKYRNAAEQPECDTAVNYIVDEAIAAGEDGSPISLAMNDLEYPDEVKDAIQKEFDEVIRLLDFNRSCSDVFRRWYVDGRLYYHIIVDQQNPSNGISELRYIDPIKMRKIREIDTKIDPETGVKLITTKAEYFVYNENMIAGQLVQSVNTGDSVTGLKIDPSAVCYVPSGLLDSTHKRIISNMHKSLKPVNQLRMMEDSLVIYRMSRAPERRIFYIDVGNLPKAKAEQYMQEIMSKYRNKMVYDSSNGVVRDDRRHMSMLEDFWLPRREGGKGTEITTLPAGENLGQIDDILFFKKNLYRSLNVPLSRFEANTSLWTAGKSTEINREEVSFQRFIDRLRRRFSYLFINVLKMQLLLKGIIVEDDWFKIKEKINIDFKRDNYFSELKEFEIMTARMDMIGKVGEFIGRYYSEKWVRRNILRQSDDEIESMDIEIAQEKAKGDISVTAGENVAQGGGQDMGAMGGAPDMGGGMPPPDMGAEAPPEVGAPEAEAPAELAGAPEAPPAPLPGAPAV
jgi:hypothetical protein